MTHLTTYRMTHVIYMNHVIRMNHVTHIIIHFITNKINNITHNKRWVIDASRFPLVFILVLILIFSVSTAFSNKIRTIRVNDREMSRIQLRMGRSSILRFSETPRKAVIGNQNYHSIEFIDNDLTIQPLDKVETNLFVYTPYHTYGFLLDVCDHCPYDDFLHVKWKPKPLKFLSVLSHQKNQKEGAKSKKLMPRFHPIDIDLVLPIGRSLFVKIIQTMVASKPSLRSLPSLRIIDIQIKNKGVSHKNIESLQIWATRKGKPLNPQSYVVGKDHLNNHESSKARLFISSKEKKAFTLHVTCGDEKGKIIIQGKYLQ